MSLDRVLVPGTLWEALRERTASARRRGALHAIATSPETVEDAGVPFLVRLAKLERKERAEDDQRRAGENPFLPCDEAMFVADVSPSHVALLNKFNVLEHHLLIVTREFEDQQEPLTLADFEALCACMAEFDGLGFYNAGRIAGASQPHKHLQLVPVPLGRGPARTPIDHVLRSATFEGSHGEAPGLPFRHAVAWNSEQLTARRVFATYRTLLDAIEDPEARRPYNLLVTRDWMLLVPRGRERFRSISVNALGFAGSLLARDRSELEAIRAVGPLAVLRGVGRPRKSGGSG